MNQNPYTFCTVNPRMVVGGTEKSNKIMIGAGLIFLYSMRAYNRRYFRIDGNVMNLVGFTSGSALASYVYADFFFGDAAADAGLKNNAEERA